MRSSIVPSLPLQLLFPGYYRKEFCSTSPKYRSTLIKIKIYVYLFIFEMGTRDIDWEGQKLTFAYKATPNFTFGLILFWVQDAKLFCAKDIRHFNGTMTFGITALRRMTWRMTFVMTTQRTTTLMILALGIMTLSKMTLVRLTIRINTLIRMTLIIMTLGRMTPARLTRENDT